MKDKTITLIYFFILLLVISCSSKHQNNEFQKPGENSSDKTRSPNKAKKIAQQSLNSSEVFDGDALSSFGFEKDEFGITYWKITNRRFEIKSVALKSPNGDKDWCSVLFLEERTFLSHIGIEGTKSHINLTAWLLDEENIKKKLWRIESEGDTWDIKDDEVVILKYGCCDEKDRSYRFEMVSGLSK